MMGKAIGVLLILLLGCSMFIELQACSSSSSSGSSTSTEKSCENRDENVKLQGRCASQSPLVGKVWKCHVHGDWFTALFGRWTSHEYILVGRCIFDYTNDCIVEVVPEDSGHDGTGKLRGGMSLDCSLQIGYTFWFGWPPFIPYEYRKNCEYVGQVCQDASKWRKVQKFNYDFVKAKKYDLISNNCKAYTSQLQSLLVGC